ncbi:unnamed protein product [Owenia fusiformis]|uniref:Uncharacterized protein n=1 Tax=Owenia fusiformis TaxID=6347 RepID=A0A8S4N2F4_OWEFU|nr:unnamed protein product [Owenia fusiformis]
MFLKSTFAFVLTLGTIQGVLSRPREDYIELSNESDDSTYSPADLNQMRRFWIRFIQKNYLDNTQVPDWLVDEEPDDGNDVGEGMSSGGGGGSGSGRKPIPDWQIDAEQDDENDYMSSGGGQTNEEYEDTRINGKKIMQPKQKTPNEEGIKPSETKQNTSNEKGVNPSQTKQKTPNEEETEPSNTKQKTGNTEGTKPSKTKQRKSNRKDIKPSKTKQKTRNEEGTKPTKTKQKTSNEEGIMPSKSKQKTYNEERVEQSKTDKEIKQKKKNPILYKTLESGHSVEEYKDNEERNDRKKGRYDRHQSAEGIETDEEINLA